MTFLWKSSCIPKQEISLKSGLVLHFLKSLEVCLIRKLLGFSYLPLQSICCDMLFWLKSLKTFQTLTDNVVGKNYFNGIFRSLWIYFVVESMLVVIYSMKSGALSVSFLYSVTLKSTDFSGILNGIFTHEWLCIGHLENVG